MFLLQPRAMRRTSLRPLAFVSALSVVGVTAAAAPAAATVDKDGNVVIDVVGITDYHGRLAADGEVAGAAVLAGAVDAVRGENPDTVFVSSGDNIGASTFTSAVQDDTPTLEALNMMDLEVSALGNHELDKGADDFSVRVNDESDFPYLAANVTGLDGVQDSHVWTSNGVSVGFIGIMTPALPSLVSPSGIEGVTVTDPAEAVDRVAADLTDGDDANGEADIIVVLAHDGAEGTDVANLDNGTAFADLVTGARANADVDAIMAGHTHITFQHDLTGGPGDLLVTQAGQYSEHMSTLRFTYDPDTDELVSRTAEITELAPEEVPAFEADAEITTLVETAEAESAVLGQVPVGEITADLRRAVTAEGADDRGGESTLGNVIADIQLQATAELGSQIAFMNPGGIRTDLIYAGDTTDNPENTDGVVTYEEAAVVQPFANTLVTFDITGAGIKQALEQQWQPAGQSRAFLKLGISEGFVYTFDATRPLGDRITGMTLDGEPIDPSATYKVTANSFLSSGGDNFDAFGEAANHADSGRIDLQAFVDHMADNSPVAPPPEQRSVGVNLGGELLAGESTPIALSSLRFSADLELGDDTVSVYLGEGTTPIGSGPVDSVIPEWTDQTGQAAFDITIPADTAPGAHVLRIVSGETVAHLPVQVGAGQPDPVGPWYLTDGLRGLPQDLVEPFLYGPVTDDVYVGDWDGNGTDTPAYRVGNTFYVRNANSTGGYDAMTAYGRATDTVYVGDWDGDGVDTFAVRRGNHFFVSNDFEGGEAASDFAYGRAGDEVLVGDWDDNGTDTVAVRRGHGFYIQNALVGGEAETTFFYGRPTDDVLIGDWDGDGADTPAIRRGQEVHVRNTLTTGIATQVTYFGDRTDRVLVGDFDGDGTDTLGIHTGGH